MIFPPGFVRGLWKWFDVGGGGTWTVDNQQTLWTQGAAAKREPANKERLERADTATREKNMLRTSFFCGVGKEGWIRVVCIACCGVEAVNSLIHHPVSVASQDRSGGDTRRRKEGSHHGICLVDVVDAKLRRPDAEW